MRASDAYLIDCDQDALHQVPGRTAQNIALKEDGSRRARLSTGLLAEIRVSVDRSGNDSQNRVGNTQHAQKRDDVSSRATSVRYL